MICLSVVQQGLPTLLLGFLQAPHYYSFVLEAVSAKWWRQYSRCICLVVLLKAIFYNITVTALIFRHLDFIWKQLNFFTAQEKASRPFTRLSARFSGIPVITETCWKWELTSNMFLFPINQRENTEQTSFCKRKQIWFQFKKQDYRYDIKVWLLFLFLTTCSLFDSNVCSIL